MTASNEKCPSCQGPLGPWSVTVNNAAHSAHAETACSDACATALVEGRGLAGAAAEDYSTMAIGVDVLRKALLRGRG